MRKYLAVTIGAIFSALVVTAAVADGPFNPGGGSGGGGTPGGSNTQVQYNNSGAFGGISGAISNGTTVQFTDGDLLIENAAVTGGSAIHAPASTGHTDFTLPATTDTLAGISATQTLTNKTISGASNTLSNIANASLTNSSVTINGASVSLGGSATVVGSPCGSSGQFQYNNAGACGGTTYFSYDGAGNLVLSSASSSTSNSMTFDNGAAFAFSISAVPGGGSAYVLLAANQNFDTMRVDTANNVSNGFGSAQTDTWTSYNGGGSPVESNIMSMDGATGKVAFGFEVDTPVLHGTGTIPTATGTGTPTVTTGSSDFAGSVTSGASATSVIITSGQTGYTTAPFCQVRPVTQLVAFSAPVTVSAGHYVITVTQTATSGDLITWTCAKNT